MNVSRRLKNVLTLLEPKPPFFLSFRDHTQTHHTR